MFRLDLDVPVPDAVLGAASAQLDQAIARLQPDGTSTASVTAVHGVRKDLKKVRSLLRLVRSDVPSRAYREEMRRLREVQTSASSMRDAQMLVDAVDGLSRRFVGRLPGGAFEQMRRALAEDAARALGSDWRATSAAIAADQRASLQRVADWPLRRCAHETLLDGATRSYRRGRRSYKTARRTRETRDLHDLRKRVKDLWHHQSLLSQAWPVALEAQAKAAHELADLLGDDHDLDVLAHVLVSPAEPAALFEHDLEELIAERRSELQSRAMSLARRVYAEKPAAYRRRLARYLDSLAAESPVAA
jgi:CHAD domain-containing protein